MQPKISARVKCLDREVGEVKRVVVDPLSREISLVIAAGGQELLVPVKGHVVNTTEQTVELNCSSGELSKFERFRREDYVDLKEVEIPHLERHLDVTPGEVLVPLPLLEQDMTRRRFFTRFINAIGAVLALPFIFPVLRYLTYPMYSPLDNSWLTFGSVQQLGEVDVPRLLKFRKTVKEGLLVRNFEKSHWVIKASPALLEKIYREREGGEKFQDGQGKVIWVNDPQTDVVVFSGKCPHLGCAYRWRKHRRFGQVFVCPCHLSIFDPSGKVLDGPAPRPLDALPVRVATNGAIEIIDLEFKAGRQEQIRIA